MDYNNETPKERPCEIQTRTRLWRNKNSSTMIQFRTDSIPMVWMHTNIGWLPLGNCPDLQSDAESFAVSVAEGYKLQEASQAMALHYLGYDDE
jgi:hypothetical protein